MKNLSLLAFVLLSSIALKAQTISDADAATLSKIKQANEKHTSITSTFKQTKHMPVLGEKILSNGSFYYAKPEQLAMRYDDPKGDLMLINNDKATLISSGKKREVSTKSNAKMRGMKSILASFMQGDVMQVGADKIAVKEVGNHIVVTAELGKANKSNISKVIGSYDKNDLTISILRTEEADGTYIIYELVGKQLNKAIDSKVFQASK